MSGLLEQKKNFPTRAPFVHSPAPSDRCRIRPVSQDPNAAPAPTAILPAFTPVPRAKDRHNGWKPEVQRAFIEPLAETGSVRAACRRVGRADHGAYLLRRHPEAASFRAAWDAALDFGVRRIEDAAMDRALYGVEETRHYHGDIVSTVRRHNERLVMFILRNRAPDRFAVGGGPRGLNAVDKMELERLKKQLRAEWEAEQDEEEAETCESLDRFLDTMHTNHLANMSPAQRTAQIAADAQARADKAAGWGPGTSYREFAAEAATLLPRFVAEVEADWPELPSWAWDAPDEDGDEADEFRALPPPPDEAKDEPEEPSGPRIRTMKDDGW
jgi:hypothetical protein